MAPISAHKPTRDQGRSHQPMNPVEAAAAQRPQFNRGNRTRKARGRKGGEVKREWAWWSWWLRRRLMATATRRWSWTDAEHLSLSASVDLTARRPIQPSLPHACR